MVVLDPKAPPQTRRRRPRLSSSECVSQIGVYDLTANLDKLTEVQLYRLKQHKYSTEGASIMEPMMQPYWRWVASLMPDSVAPNMLTLIGLTVNIVSFVLLVYYSGLDAKNSAPSWVYLLFAVCLFIYETLDAIDGKHARRLGLSSKGYFVTWVTVSLNRKKSNLISKSIG